MGMALASGTRRLASGKTVTFVNGKIATDEQLDQLAEIAAEARNERYFEERGGLFEDDAQERYLEGLGIEGV